MIIKYLKDLIATAKQTRQALQLCIALVSFAGLDLQAVQSVTLAWDPSPDPDVTTYNVYYGTLPASYSVRVPAGNATNVVVTDLVEGQTYYFVATAMNSSGLESDPSNEVSYTVPTVVTNNNPPTLNLLFDVVVNESASEQTVNLSGISSGATNETQTLTVTATSSNPALIPHPAVSYTSPSATGTLRFTPVAFGYGSATITVQVNDGATANNSVTRSFQVTVNPVNQAPTLNELSALSLPVNPGEQVVELRGISSGAANENDILTVTATSSHPALVPQPAVDYTSPSSTGLLRFTPAAGAGGDVTLTVQVSDGQPVNGITTRSFVVSLSGTNHPPTLNSLPDITLDENAAVQVISLTGISSGAAFEDQRLTVSATSSNPGLIPNPTVSYASPQTIGTLTLRPSPFASGVAVIAVRVNDGQPANNSVTRSFTVTVNAVNQAPTLNALADLVLSENASVQTVNLSGITSGAANEIQLLSVTATSSNPALIPHPTVTYTSPAPTGSLAFQPVTNGFGSALITVLVNDGGVANNSVVRSFQVTVNPINEAPTLNALSDLVIDQDAGPQTVNLTGITSGAANEIQTLTVTATSSNPALVPNPTVSYTSPNATGVLIFTPAAGASGSAVISISVNDGGTVNHTLTRSFKVSVRAANHPPTLNRPSDMVLSANPGQVTVQLTGITSGDTGETQALTVTASSSNPALIPQPLVSYTSPNTAGTLRFTPVTDATGTAVITVQVSDGQSLNNSVSCSFTVTINPANHPPTLDEIGALTLPLNPGQQVVQLTGISAGAATETDELTVTASASNPSLVSELVVDYTSPGSIGHLRFTPATNAAGSLTITVQVSDGHPGNGKASRSFIVTLGAGGNPPTIDTLPDVVLYENAGVQVVNLTGISSGGSGSSLGLSVAASSSNPTLIPHPAVTQVSQQGTATLTFRPAAFASGTAVISVRVRNGNATNSLTAGAFTVTVTAVNQAPTLGPLGNLVLPVNAGPQTLPLSGISSGANNEAQVLTVTAVSSQPSLIPHPIVNYTNPASVGSLQLTPAANSSGVATIIVIVDDGQSANRSVARSFTVTVGQPGGSQGLASAASTESAQVAGVSLSPLVADVTTALLSSSSVVVPAESKHTEVAKFSGRNSGAIGVVATPTPAPRVVRPRQLSLPILQADGSVELVSRDSEGEALDESNLTKFQVWVSADLASWQQAPATFRLDDGALVARDSSARNHPRRYYRLIELP